MRAQPVLVAGCRYTHWYELLSRALTPPLLLVGAVELVITPRVIRHVIASQGLQPRTWGDQLRGLLPRWLQWRDDANARRAPHPDACCSC